MPRDLNSDVTLKDCLFGGVKLDRNTDPDKCVYIGYGIGFELHSEFSLPDGGSVGESVIIFGVDMSSSVNIDDEKKDILTLGKGPTQGLDDTTLTAETPYSINFSRSNESFVSDCIIMGATVFLFVNATKIYQFKAKDSEIKKYLLCLGNISGVFSANIMKKNKQTNKKKKTELNGCLYDFFSDCRTFDASNIVNIHDYLMKKHNIKQCLG